MTITTEAVLQLADALSELATALRDQPGTPPAADPTPEPAGPDAVPLETVRAALADMSRAGHTEQVRDLLRRFDASRLSEVDPGHYADLLAAAEELS